MKKGLLWNCLLTKSVKDLVISTAAPASSLSFFSFLFCVCFGGVVNVGLFVCFFGCQGDYSLASAKCFSKHFTITWVFISFLLLLNPNAVQIE